VRERCDWPEFQRLARLRRLEPQLAGSRSQAVHRRARRPSCAAAARLLRDRRQLGASTTASASPSTAQGSHHGHGALPTSAMADRQRRPRGVGVNPLRGRNNVQGACDMGSFPHELPGYRHVSDPTTGAAVRGRLGRDARSRARACASPTCSTRRPNGQFKGIYIQGEDILQSDPVTPSMWRRVAAAMERGDRCTTCSSTRPRATRTCSCRAPPSLKRTAPSPTPSAASSRCARRWSRKQRV